MIKDLVSKAADKPSNNSLQNEQQQGCWLTICIFGQLLDICVEM